MFPSKKFDVGKLSHDNLSLDSSEAWSMLINDQQNPLLRIPDQNTSQANFHLKEDEKGSAFASLGIVKDFPSKSRKINGENVRIPCSTGEHAPANDQKLSTTARIRMAGQHFIDSYSSKAEEILKLNHPHAFSFCGLSDDEAKDIELLLTLLHSAEKTGQKQFNCAIKIIESYRNMSLNEGNHVERLVYYFSEAIHIYENKP